MDNKTKEKENSRKISRRDFLRLSLTFAASAALASCQPTIPAPEDIEGESSPTPIPAPTVTTAAPTPTPSPPQVTLAGTDSDAWTWVKTVRGMVEGGECEALTITVNGRSYPAAFDGKNFSVEIELEEGENRIEAICRQVDGREVRSQMIHYQDRLREAPIAQIDISLEDGRILLNGSASQPAKESGPAIVDRIWYARPGNPGTLTIAGLEGIPERALEGEISAASITLLPPQESGEYYIHLRVKDAVGREDTAGIYFVVENGQPRIPSYDTENVAWIENTVVYGVIPRNFGSPAFKAVTEKLDYLRDLGIDALWLAPVNVSPPADYGYAVVDYFELNPRYGTKEDFHRMVQEAHARGIRVLMDFVPNHSSAQHPYFQDTVEKGEESPYWDFYDRDENGIFTHYFDWEHLPNLNYENPEVERWMTEAFSYWVREFDIDGFRVDVAWGIRERKPDYWPRWRRALKRIKPDLLLLAEASARDPYYFDNGWDAAYDWTDQLGKWAWELVWDSYKNRLLTYNLEDALTNRPTGYHPDALIFRFLNNNDTGDRFITRHGEGMTRVSTALLLSLPGIPCIYTGDEVGEWFRPYFDPNPLTWDERYPGLREYHKKLIALRKSTPSLHSRLWAPVRIQPLPQEVYAYARFTGSYENPVLVVLNFSEEPAEVVIDISEELSALAAADQLIDRLAEDGYAITGQNPLQISVPALTARILSAGA
jgi:glycosidase